MTSELRRDLPLPSLTHLPCCRIINNDKRRTRDGVLNEPFGTRCDGNCFSETSWLFHDDDIPVLMNIQNVLPQLNLTIDDRFLTPCNLGDCESSHTQLDSLMELRGMKRVFVASRPIPKDLLKSKPSGGVWKLAKLKNYVPILITNQKSLQWRCQAVAKLFGPRGGPVNDEVQIGRWHGGKDEDASSFGK